MSIFFRLPILTIIFWLLLGLSIGWWLHSLYPTANISTANTNADTQSSRADISPEQEAEAETMPYKKLLSQTPATPKSFSLADHTQLKNDALILLDEDVVEAKQMLDTWIQKDPGVPEPILLLARAYLKSGEYQKALDTALELRAYIQSDVPTQDIDSLISEIESLYSAELYERQAFGLLLSLYETLITAIPEKGVYYYKLAEVQEELNQHAEALTTLDFILYDEVWGEKARHLAQAMQINIDLEDQIEIPLERIANQFIVQVSINGIPGVRLLLDTGASICVLRPQAAERLGLFINEEDDITVNLPAGVVNTPTSQIDLLAIGDAQIEDAVASIIEMPPGIQTDGLLGMNFLGRFRFFIDQKNATLYLGAR